MERSGTGGKLFSPLPIEVTNLEISNLEVGSLRMEEVIGVTSHAQVPWSQDQVWADIKVA